jgi:hypothetical protein
MKFKTTKVLFFICLFSTFSLNAQTGVLPVCDSVSAKPALNAEPQTINEITIYVMPTMYPLDWTSPASLYNSMQECFFKTRKVPANYLLGHLAIRIKTPLLDSPMLFAMTAADKWERLNLVLKKKIGFGIMGYPLAGRFETERELTENMAVYAKRNKLAFINFRINETAAKRMIEMVKEMSLIKEDNKAACNYYGGAFWPRYENEGSGCSAMGMALLDVADILPVESEEWMVRVRIPMSVVGGELNGNKKIKTSVIRKSFSWYEGEGIANVDYINYTIYDPSIIFNWIMAKRQLPSSIIHSVEEDGVPGLFFDLSGKQIDDNEPLFIKRTNPDRFIEQYKIKRGL